MSLSRRSFLKGTMALAGVTMMPITAMAIGIPVIRGDGIHDDTAGLKALASGKPFQVDGMHIAQNENSSTVLSEGNFRITDRIEFSGVNNIAICNCELVMDSPDAELYIHDVERIIINNNIFRRTNDYSDYGVQI